MFTRQILRPVGGVLALAAVAAVVLTFAVQPSAALAGEAATVVGDASAVRTSASEATDFSSRRRTARRYYRRNDAAGLAFMGMALGTMGAIMAEQRRRDAYRNYYYYGGGPYYGGHYYGGAPYYGGGPYYPVPMY